MDEKLFKLKLETKYMAIKLKIIYGKKNIEV